jgi:hypothetical protein
MTQRRDTRNTPRAKRLMRYAKIWRIASGITRIAYSLISHA